MPVHDPNWAVLVPAASLVETAVFKTKHEERKLINHAFSNKMNRRIGDNIAVPIPVVDDKKKGTKKPCSKCKRSSQRYSKYCYLHNKEDKSLLFSSEMEM